MCPTTNYIGEEYAYNVIFFPFCRMLVIEKQARHLNEFYMFPELLKLLK